ncbi:hypothetical protein JCM3774_003591 [Rhodotorula dairenensis]
MEDAQQVTRAEEGAGGGAAAGSSEEDKKPLPDPAAASRSPEEHDGSGSGQTRAAGDADGSGAVAAAATAATADEAATGTAVTAAAEGAIAETATANPAVPATATQESTATTTALADRPGSPTATGGVGGGDNIREQSASPVGHLGSSPSPNRNAGSPSSSSPAQHGSSPSPTSSASSSPASHAPSRRVKVYRLKDDAWIDLGTGTCTGEFFQSVPTPTAGEHGASGSGHDLASEVEEGAWILVKREKPTPRKKGRPAKHAAAAAQQPGDGSPVRKKKKKEDGSTSPDQSLTKDLVEDEEGAGEGEAGGAAHLEEGIEAAGENGSDSDDESDVILRSRVQPYPPGISPDDLPDDDEVTSVDENGNMTIDAGGYQRQQETLIVWTERTLDENDEEQEMALSFATGSGCSEIWEFIKAARRYLAEQAALRSPSPAASDALSSPPRHLLSGSSFASLANSLPEPTLGSVTEFDAALRAMSRSAVGRERAASVVLRTGVIEKLCKLQAEAEEAQSLEDLHALCRVMQQILLLNDNAIFEHVLQDDVILGVVGILEYDPEFPTMRASYRQHLSSPTAFVPVVPPHLLGPALLGKIHQTHRLHYLKDIVLARVIEDSTFSMLNSAIYFNEVEIVNVINTQGDLLLEVFRILKNQNASELTKGRSAGADATDAPASPSSKGKERSLALGPKRTIGPDLPDDLLAARAAKRPRVGSPPAPAEATPLSSPTKSTPVGIDPATLSESERKLHAMLFLQQLAQMAKNLQLPPRTAFYKNMCERGLLSALEGALRFAIDLPPDEEDTASTIRSAALGVWIAVVDLDPADVRAFCLRQGKEQEAREEVEREKDDGGAWGEDLAAVLEADLAEETQTPEEAERAAREKKVREERSTLLGLLLWMFKDEEDLGIKAQLTEALRVLVDVTGEGSVQPGPRMRQEDPEAERFLQYFYDHCVLSLVQPLLDLPEPKDSAPPLNLSSADIAILTHLCDLLCFFVSNHTFRSKYLILSTPALAKAIGRLLRPKPRLTRHTHLRLAALRFLRACVARSDEFYNRFLVKHDLIRPVLETVAEERDKDNLLGSACLEFFEHLRIANVKALLNHVMDRSGETARKLAAGTGLSPPLRTFEALISRWEMNNEPPPPVSLMADTSADSARSPTSGATSSSMQRQTSQPGWTPRRELEEESYFNTSDDEEEDETDASKDLANWQPLPLGAGGPSPDILKSPSIVSSRRKREAIGEGKLEGRAWFLSQGNRTSDDTDAAKTSSPAESKLPLVQYGDDDAGSDGEAADEPKQVLTAADPLAGGFVKDDDAMSELSDDDTSRGTMGKKRGAHDDDKPNVTLESFRQDIATPPHSSGPPDEDGAPPFLPSLGSLKRKKEEEDDDGELGLLAKKRAPSTAGSPPSRNSNGSAPPGVSTSPSSSGPTAASTPTATTKLGGFKIALGGLKSKFGPAGGGGKGSDLGGTTKPGS